MRSSRTILIPTTVAFMLVLGGAITGCSESSAASSATTAASAPQTVSLPASFPRSDVPLIDGSLLTAVGDPQNGWSITIEPSSTNGLAQAKALLVKAGYTTQSAGSGTAAFVGPKFNVLVSSPGKSVTYALTPKE